MICSDRICESQPVASHFLKEMQRCKAQMVLGHSWTSDTSVTSVVLHWLQWWPAQGTMLLRTGWNAVVTVVHLAHRFLPYIVLVSVLLVVALLVLGPSEAACIGLLSCRLRANQLCIVNFQPRFSNHWGLWIQGSAWSLLFTLGSYSTLQSLHILSVSVPGLFWFAALATASSSATPSLQSLESSAACSSRQGWSGWSLLRWSMPCQFRRSNMPWHIWHMLDKSYKSNPDMSRWSSFPVSVDSVDHQHPSTLSSSWHPKRSSLMPLPSGCFCRCLWPAEGTPGLGRGWSGCLSSIQHSAWLN